MSNAARRSHGLMALVCCAIALGALSVWAIRVPEPASTEVASFGARPGGVTSPESADQPSIALRGSTPSAKVGEQNDGSQPTGSGPAILSIPAIGVAAEVDRVGVRDDGQVFVPDDGRRIGWYRFGPAPGGLAGSAVLVGHRDTRAQGAGALYRLGALDRGDQIQVVREDWSTLTYSVVSLEALDKAVFPAAELFRRDGAPVLTVITCGGEYIAGRGYTENVVVTAVALEPTAQA